LGISSSSSSSSVNVASKQKKKRSLDDLETASTVSAPAPLASPKTISACTQPKGNLSLIERLQGHTDASVRARQLICSVPLALRNVIVGVVTLGFYYALHPRRTKFSAMWRDGFTKGDKLRGSALAWAGKLGLSDEYQNALADDILAFFKSCWTEVDEEKERLKAARLAEKEALKKKNAKKKPKSQPQVQSKAQPTTVSVAAASAAASKGPKKSNSSARLSGKK
jgi:hypothetical protein